MSYKTTSIAWKELNILNANSLQSIIKNLEECINQKLTKLNVILKQMDLYVFDGQIIINDRYNVCSDIEKIVEAFGMEIKKLDTTLLKGKSYIVSDMVISLLKQLGVNYDFNSIIESKNIDERIKELINQSRIAFKNISNTYNDELVEYLEKILKEGTLKVKETSIYDDNRLISVESDYDNINKQLESFLKNIKKQTESNNAYMQKGTSELITYRAKQLGYAVKQEKNGKEIQLVLVRMQ